MNNLHIQHAYCIYTIAIITLAQSNHNSAEAIKTLTLCRIMVIHEDLPFEFNKLILQRQQLLLLCHYLIEMHNEKSNIAYSRLSREYGNPFQCESPGVKLTTALKVTSIKGSHSAKQPRQIQSNQTGA